MKIQQKDSKFNELSFKGPNDDIHLEFLREILSMSHSEKKVEEKSTCVSFQPEVDDCNFNLTNH